MFVKAIVFGVVLLTPVVAVAAENPCASPPAPVQSYVAKQAGWSLVGRADLVDRVDEGWWDEYHRNDCPGFTAVRLDASGQTSYAMALIARSGDTLEQKIVVLRLRRGAWFPETLGSPYKPEYPAVVFRGEPGVAWNWDGSRHVKN